MSGRRAGRRTALFLLYQWDVTGQPLASLYEGEVDEFARETAEAVAEQAPKLDERITAVAPFNFGGPQPETKFPLRKDAKVTFNYAGSGSWESTRNLARSAKDGFLPWVIVGAAGEEAGTKSMS